VRYRRADTPNATYFFTVNLAERLRGLFDFRQLIAYDVLLVVLPLEPPCYPPAYPKGQIVIPSALRTELHLEPGTRFDVRVENGRLLLEPIKEPEFDLEAIRVAVDRVAGCLYRPDRVMTTEEEDEQAIMKMLAEDDEHIRRGE